MYVAHIFPKQGFSMFNSSPYINSAMIGAAGMSVTRGADADVRPVPAGTEPNQNRGTRPNNPPVFPADGDTIELSPAARQLAQQKPGNINTPADEASRYVPGSAQNETAAPRIRARAVKMETPIQRQTTPPQKQLSPMHLVKRAKAKLLRPGQPPA